VCAEPTTSTIFTSVRAHEGFSGDANSHGAGGRTLVPAKKDAFILIRAQRVWGACLRRQSDGEKQLQ